MRTHPVRLAVAGLSLIAVAGFGCNGAGAGTSSDGVAQAQGGPPALLLERLSLPPGFEIAVWGRVPGARSLTRGENGTIFVGTREASGGVYALRDNDGDGEADELHTLAEELFMPNGVAVRGSDSSRNSSTFTRLCRGSRDETVRKWASIPRRPSGVRSFGTTTAATCSAIPSGRPTTAISSICSGAA